MVSAELSVRPWSGCGGATVPQAVLGSAGCGMTRQSAPSLPTQGCAFLLKAAPGLRRGLGPQRERGDESGPSHGSNGYNAGDGPSSHLTVWRASQPVLT